MGSILAPWANWGVEKRKIKHQRREQLLKAVREALLNNNDTHYEPFIRSIEYSQIRPYLTKPIVEKIENLEDNVIHIVIGKGRNSGVNNFTTMILDDLSRLEKELNLV